LWFIKLFFKHHIRRSFLSSLLFWSECSKNQNRSAFWASFLYIWYAVVSDLCSTNFTDCQWRCSKSDGWGFLSIAKRHVRWDIHSKWAHVSSHIVYISLLPYLNLVYHNRDLKRALKNRYRAASIYY
jgi:hypothetical protein